MPELSVIVPVYDAEKYLPCCLDSILNQTIKNMEVIVVDDGSTDSSGAICDEYAAGDGRIKVIHKRNGGVSDARNAGLAVASGNYIAFVDADDYIAPEMYENMLRELKNNDLDIIRCGAFRVKGEKIIGSVGSGNLSILDGKAAMLKALSKNYGDSLWNKVYKTDVIRGVRFPVGRKYEDASTSYLLFANARRIGHLDRAYYYYRFNSGSICQTSFDPVSRWDFVLAYMERLAYAERNMLPCVAECKTLLIKAALSCLTAVYYAPDTDGSREIYEKIRELIRKYRCGAVYQSLNLKYKLYLWSFGRLDIVHKIGSRLSFLSKKMRKL